MPTLRARSRIASGPERLRSAAVQIVQCSVAAGLAWAIATSVIGHRAPFFAPVAAVVTLGVSVGGKVRRSVELVLGVGIGIGVGDLLIARVGTGPWQIALVVGLAIVVTLIFDAGPVITTQAASSAVLVATLSPPHGASNFDRMIDGFVGGAVALAVIALLPAHPMSRARRSMTKILRSTAGSLRESASGLLEQDAVKVEAALASLRGTQSAVDELRGSLRGGREVSRLAPLYWRSRPEILELGVRAEALDHAIRNLRVMLRRCRAVVRDDEILDAGLIDEIERLAFAVEVLADAYSLHGAGTRLPTQHSDAGSALRLVAKGARPELIAAAGLSAHSIFAQLRSALVDLQTMVGVSRTTAIATLPPLAVVVESTRDDDDDH